MRSYRGSYLAGIHEEEKKGGNMIDIIAIKTDDGFFIQTAKESYRRGSGLSHLFFDGETPGKTFHPHWDKIQSLPGHVEKELPAKRTNHRYELIDPTMASDKIPDVFVREDAAVQDRDGYWAWKTEYAHLESLYKLKYDETPAGKETVEYTLEISLEVSGIKEYADFSYPVQRTEWSHEGLTTLTPKDAKHQVLDRILFPEIILKSKPCEFTSEQSYKIVRQHIKAHIDPKVAEITSDYNFCFTVKKLVGLQNPYETKHEILTLRGKSYKNKQYRSSYVKSRHVEVFEMTHTGSNYKGYTPIRGFRGKDQGDLKEAIDEYLAELMAMINAPLHDCPACDGMGVIVG